ncbi:MAG: hypothetical protein HRU77_02735 [Gammaproteobacteria bacterium]|nr:MAG: hypothetical protein HRU77_02735 [Gammaproteobacteria bacterium]
MKTKDLAELLGISQQMCNRLKKRGMPTDSLDSAIEWRKRNLDPTQTKQMRIDGNSGGRAVSTVSISTVSNETVEDNRTLEELQAVVNSADQLNLDGSDADELYKNSRALKEKALAMQAKLEYDMAMGNLVIRDDVHKAAFEASRMLRDKLQGLPQQTAPNLHGKTVIEMQHILSDEINRLLTQFCGDLEAKNLI